MSKQTITPAEHVECYVCRKPITTKKCSFVVLPLNMPVQRFTIRTHNGACNRAAHNLIQVLFYKDDNKAGQIE